MLCQKCMQQEATVHVSKNINGEKSETHLCAQCAKLENEWNGMHMSDWFDVNIGDFLSGMMQAPAGYVQKPAESVCPKCGMSLREFQQHGRLGCLHCYDAYRRQLRPLLKQIHGEAAHTGKMPKGADVALRLKRETEALQQKLQEAIQSERYEDAAKLRDEIRKLQKDEKEGGASNEK